MTRDDFLTLWRSSWDQEGWFAPWKNALADLSAAQAAWKPASGSHSIWQNVNHVIFWRRYTMCTARGQPKPSNDETERANFAEPDATTDAAWKKTLAELEQSHRDIESVIADGARPLDRVQHHLAHDAYHLGQIMQLRAMQGLKPLI